MELQVAKHEDAPEAVEDIWGSAAQMAMVGSFVILLGICLYLCRPILLPVAAAIVIGTTLAPLVKAAARHRIPPWLTAGILGLALLAAAPTCFLRMKADCRADRHREFLQSRAGSLLPRSWTRRGRRRALSFA